ncbi:NAD-dependent epimerase/dehydratase family protein [Nocardioides sp. HDW12B]|uniref:NAD-dependent epimerase/dehydratase family protein n=1 Tax=Nocardioides sp. HDW12B TaxID=2714939 RepID=UPI001408B53A|nr:NAD-dependent epimerase/dehydratase family protein [Nocardioides sp. HDW12B]QIK66112.1 NAD-dependent epimerase/dehydratase family protein [Nocardioides sp. HDW12B]
MKVLLTGASGFIGAAIRDQLDASGHDVVAVDALIPQAHGTDTVPDVSVHRLDVRQADTWVDLLRGVDVVCHQSAMVGAGVTVADMPLYASHNDLGTAVLLAAMEEAGVKRLVFASSMVVYGEGRYVCATHGHVQPGVRTVADLEAGRFDNPCPSCDRALGWELVDEDARLDPRSSYAASKLATEHYASAWVRQADARAVGLRYHNVYGARMPRDTPYSGVAAIFRSSLERGESPRVFEDGGQMRDFVHVTDVARANLASIEAVAEDRLAPYEAFNVCSGEPVSIRDVAQMLGAASGIDPVVTGQYRLGDVRHVVASPERARQVLGFSAQVGPEQGLAAFVHEPLRT